MNVFRFGGLLQVPFRMDNHRAVSAYFHLDNDSSWYAFIAKSNEFAGNEAQRLFIGHEYKNRTRRFRP